MCAIKTANDIYVPMTNVHKTPKNKQNKLKFCINNSNFFPLKLILFYYLLICRTIKN